MKNKILSVEWRSGSDTVGIVAVEHSYGWCAYIGVAKGLSMLASVKHIRDFGAKLSKKEALVFFPQLRDREKEYNYE